jgi:hypothetical protein
MPQPDADGGELDGGEEVVVALVVSGGDATAEKAYVFPFA